MSEMVPPTTEVLKEALSLSSEVLRNIELSKIPLTNIALKASRLARLLNEYDIQKIMQYEASGYPSKPDGIPRDICLLNNLKFYTKIRCLSIPEMAQPATTRISQSKSLHHSERLP